MSFGGIVNNLAACYAQHPNQALPIPESALADAPLPTRASYLEAAQRWARNADKVATETTGEARTAECDHACAVALCNLGDIALLLGDAGEARRRFEQGRETSARLGFAEGVSQAETGLQKIGQ